MSFLSLDRRITVVATRGAVDFATTAEWRLASPRSRCLAYPSSYYFSVLRPSASQVGKSEGYEEREMCKPLRCDANGVAQIVMIDVGVCSNRECFLAVRVNEDSIARITRHDLFVSAWQKAAAASYNS